MLITWHIPMDAIYSAIKGLHCRFYLHYCNHDNLTSIYCYMGAVRLINSSQEITETYSAELCIQHSDFRQLDCGRIHG